MSVVGLRREVFQFGGFHNNNNLVILRILFSELKASAYLFSFFFLTYFFFICIRTSMKTEEASTSRKATKLQKEKVPVENPSGFTRV